MKQLLCIHGNSLAGGIFSPLRHTELANNFEIDTIELPGHNNHVANNPRAYKVENLISYLSKCIAKYDGDKYILAHSLGGHLLLQAIELTNSIRGVVLVGAPPLLSLNDYAAAITPMPGMLMQKGEWNNAELNLLAHATCTSNAHKIKQLLSATDPVFRTAVMGSLANYTYQDEIAVLKKSKHPTIVINSVYDSFINPNYIRRLPELLSDSNHIQVINTDYKGHAPFLSAPENFTKLLLKSFGKEFLSKSK